MKKLSLFFTVLFVTARLVAQTNSTPVRLGLIVESSEAATVGDVLTAELSKNGQLHLLERAEIEKVYREQGLSAANKDYLKLGQILGADGLWLFEVNRSAQQTNLTARLIAVKPGVVLLEENFTWPLANVTEWASSVANHVDPILPKLTVLVKDAIPISVVNLRSAVQSADALETERQLKLLTIQRLSRERQLFVLERQRMQLLSEEKNLKADESAFWSGSYLLEGVVDQNGYSKEIVTINARLTPSKGGAPLRMEVSGSRTNFAEVINQLALKVNEALKVVSTVKEWNAVDEAAQYFEEAKWAFRWGVLPEAQAAADSAWALGKRDMDCALVRVESYKGSPAYEHGSDEHGTIGRSIIDSSDEADRQATIKHIKRIFATHSGAVFALGIYGMDYVPIDNPSDARSLGHVTHALELYREFSQTLPEGEPKVDSAWYGLGVESLTVAAQVLQHYYLAPKSQGDVVDKLSELRALASSVAGWISRSPSVHDSYFTVVSNPDKERRILIDNPNIYHCKANWGCFWQEKPEDCVALYRDLLSSPAFSYFADEFGSSAQISNSRGLERPRLVAWNEADRKRVSAIWGNFIRELNDSTNKFLQEMGETFKSLRPAGANEAEMLVQYDEYWRAIQSAKRNILTVGKQIEYLKANDTGDINSLVDEFLVTESTKNQALEIKPLLAAYRANLIAQMATKSGVAKINLEYAIKYVEGGQASVDRILNNAQPNVAANDAVLPPPATPKSELTQKTNLVSGVRLKVMPKIPEVPVEIIANVLLVKSFLAIPQKSFPKDEKFLEEDRAWGLRIVASRWVGGKLVADLRYHCEMHINGGGGDVTKAVAAIFDPANKSWEILAYPPESYEGGYPQWPYDEVPFEIYHGSFLFSDGGKIQKYDSSNKQWESIQVPGLNNSKLFVVDGRLYAASDENIFEITENGKGTHILASTRRRPAASALDLLSSLGSPVLFSGLNHSLCASIGNESFGWEQNKSFSWDGSDWHEIFSLKTTRPVEIFEDAVILRHSPLDSINNPSMVWLWDKHSATPELALYEKAKRAPNNLLGQKSTTPTMSPLWKSLENYSLANASMTYFKSNLFCYVDRASVKHLPNGKPVPERAEHDADLICLDRDCPQPIIIPLKYDLNRGPLPLPGHWPDLSPVWMTFTSDFLLIGNKSVPGIWAIPITEINAAFAAEKQRMLAKNEGAKFDGQNVGKIDGQ